MPLISSQFRPSRGLANGHLQTILPALLPVKAQPGLHRERLTLADGDFVDLDWNRSGNKKLAILSHGLEGSSQAVYIRRMMRALQVRAWDVMAWNYRGCSGETNHLLRSYHSGESADLRTVVEHAATAYEEISLIGFSLGGNITLKYLGEAPPHAKVTAAAAISAPVDLASSARKLDERRSNAVYLRRFLKSLIAKIEAKALMFPDHLETAGLRRIASFREFDDRYTAPLHGFRNADDYWAKSSSLPWLPEITAPALLLNAHNDPFLSSECLPVAVAKDSRWLFLETPESGGHLGFIDRTDGIAWLGRRVMTFLERRQ